MNLVGFRTVIVGLLMTIVVPALTYLAGVDWTALGVSPVLAVVISGTIMMILRYFTSTPITKPNAVASVAAMPDVVKIITTSDKDGRALANSVPSDKVLAAVNPAEYKGVGLQMGAGRVA